MSSNENIRPQPSGETRDIGATSRLTKLIEDMENLKRAYHPSTFSDPVSSFWRDVEALSARPLASGGQHSGGEWRCEDCGAQADEWFDCCKNPARAEAQGEGAAGEPVTLAECPPGLFLWNGTLGFKSEYGAMEPIGSNFKTWKVGSRADAYCADSGEYFWGGTSNHADRDKVLVVPVDAASAHPSPTPAADADRVRIAVEAFNAKINAPLTGPTHGAWDRGRIAGLKEALAALKSEGK